MRKNKTNVKDKIRVNKFLFLIIFFLCITFAHSQNTSDTTNSNVRGIINVNYLEIPFGEIRVSYEKPLKNNISWENGVGIVYNNAYQEGNPNNLFDAGSSIRY